MKTRTQNIKKNLIFNVIKYVAQLLLQFMLRTILIYIMGAEYLGLNGLFTNIFAFLNIAELGIGSAIVFNMYKPIAEGNIEEVKSLQAIYRKFYVIIACIVAGVGVILLPFLKFLINGEVTVDINIYILYVLYLVNTLIGYFSAHKRSILFAYQRNDVESKITTISLFGMTLFQILALFLFRNYYIFFSINIVFSIIECVVVHVCTNKMYPELNGSYQQLDEGIKKDIYKNIKALSVHKIAGVVVFSIDNILISSLLGLIVLGAYSNYYLIVSALIAIFTLFSNALKGSVGNLIASSDKDYVHSKFKQINILFSVFAAFCTTCMIVLFQPFIRLWTNGNEVYLLEFSSVVLLCFSFYLSKMRTATCMFKDCAGLFYEDRFKPIVEAVVNLVLSIVLGIWLGLNGIIMGTIISTIVAPLWVEPVVLYKHYFKRSVWTYFKQYILDMLIMVGCTVICYIICSFIPSGTIWLLVAKVAVCVILSAGILLVAYLPFKDFRQCWSLLKFINEKKKN